MDKDISFCTETDEELYLLRTYCDTIEKRYRKVRVGENEVIFLFTLCWYDHCIYSETKGYEGQMMRRAENPWIKSIK